MPELRSFVYVLRPPRPTFLQDGTPEELAIVGEHFEYLKGLLGQGVLQFAGRCDDAEFGIALFEAKGDAEAKAIMDADPAIKAGVFSATLHPFSVALWAE